MRWRPQKNVALGILNNDAAQVIADAASKDSAAAEKFSHS
jgi:hypothetical protein